MIWKHAHTNLLKARTHILFGKHVHTYCFESNKVQKAHIIDWEMLQFQEWYSASAEFQLWGDWFRLDCIIYTQCSVYKVFIEQGMDRVRVRIRNQTKVKEMRDKEWKKGRNQEEDERNKMKENTYKNNYGRWKKPQNSEQ